ALPCQFLLLGGLEYAAALPDAVCQLHWQRVAGPVLLSGWPHGPVQRQCLLLLLARPVQGRQRRSPVLVLPAEFMVTRGQHIIVRVRMRAWLFRSQWHCLRGLQPRAIRERIRPAQLLGLSSACDLASGGNIVASVRMFAWVRRR